MKEEVRKSYHLPWTVSCRSCDNSASARGYLAVRVIIAIKGWTRLECWHTCGPSLS